MTCRHRPDDPSCSSHPDNIERMQYERELEEERRREKERLARMAETPDASNYEITQVARVGPHLVLKVQYPNCAKCVYEGNKIMVFLDVKEHEVIRWRTIDPHFRDPKKIRTLKEAPPPAARFPASTDGWSDALAYAQGKVKG